MVITLSGFVIVNCLKFGNTILMSQNNRLLLKKTYVNSVNILLDSVKLSIKAQLCKLSFLEHSIKNEFVFRLFESPLLSNSSWRQHWLIRRRMQSKHLHL